MNINEILNVATYAGKIMLESGAEAYRVEETINNISRAYGIEVPDSYATPTVIISSANHEDELRSVVVRIKKRSVDLDKIHKVNDLSRNILNKNYSIKELKEKLESIENEVRYSKILTILCGAFGAFGFVYLFNGSFNDSIAAFFIGMIVKYVDLKASKIGINSFFVTVLCSIVVALLTIFMIKINIADDMDIVIISSIMLLVPGLAITNAIRDTIAGDLVSGIARGLEAFLTALAVAVGTGVVLNFFISSFGGL